MDWSAATWWWVAVGVLVIAELGSGTFYLLMLALGAAAAALGAYAGLDRTGQLVVAAVVGGGAVTGWYFNRRRYAATAPTASNHDVNLDIGARIHVSHWNADGTARVHYRGAEWDVRYQGTGTPIPGEYFVRALQGSKLLLDK